jgi:hypothetical protein
VAAKKYYPMVSLVINHLPRDFSAWGLYSLTVSIDVNRIPMYRRQPVRQIARQI